MGRRFHFDVYLLGFVLLSTMIASVGFLSHLAVSPVPFWASFVCLNVLAWKADWRHAALFSGGVVILLVATAFTFGYTQIDGIEYHTPMQLLLREGWNPIYESTMEKLLPLVGDRRDVWPYHVLCLPKYNALCGAIVAKATGLWIANGFLNYVLMIAAFVTAFRFARFVWSIGSFPAAVFAIGVTFGRQISSIQTGQVDYIVYATFVSAAFSGWMLVESYDARNAFVFFSSIAIGALTKSTAVIWGGGMVALLLILCWRRVRLPMCAKWLLLLIAYCSLVGAASYLTNWVNYGSPLYPNHTFSSAVQTVDITSDFTGNADLLSMGRFSRIAYAWISPEWTIRFLRLLRHAPEFNPVSTVGQGGVSGLGSGFRLLLGLSVVCLAASRKGAALYLCIFTFVISNCVPVKYIGYSRYFPQMWIIPIVAGCNLLFVPSAWISRAVARVRPFVMVLLVAIFGCIVFRYGLLHLRMMVLEGMRQDTLAEAACVSRKWHVARSDAPSESGSSWLPYSSQFGYAMRSRLQAGGIDLNYDTISKPRFVEDR